MKTENRILTVARKKFLLYGFHATTIQLIATDIGANKASVHYYFRSKQKLYEEIIKEIIPMLKNMNFPKNLRFSYLWFILNELRTNRSHFIETFNQHTITLWSQEIENSVITEFSYISLEELTQNFII